MAYVSLPRTIGFGTRVHGDMRGSYQVDSPLRRRVYARRGPIGKMERRPTTPNAGDVQMRKGAPKQMTSAYANTARITYLGMQGVEETKAIDPTSTSLPSPLFSAKIKKPKTPRGGNTFGGFLA